MSALVHSSTQPLTLLFPPNPAFASNPPSGGILLNPARSRSSSPSSRSYSLPITPEKFGTTKSLPSQVADRKIRFAPLPDPRRTPSDDDKDDYSPVFLDDDDTAKLYSKDGLSISPNLSSSNSDDTPILSKEARWSRKLLKSFLAVSPNKSSFDEGGGGGGKLGVGGLFRASSRESMCSNYSELESTLPTARRKSVGSAPPYVTSITSSSQIMRPTLSNDSTFSTNSAPAKRLLNGRVYGGQRSKSQSSSLGDSYEPEFVEWGYGGMGSNKSGERFYNGVQSRGSSIMGEHDDDDDYDGSGMGWVRKRRAQRAKEAAERERRESQDRAEGKGHSPPPEITVVSPPHSPKSEHGMHFGHERETEKDAQEHQTTTVVVPHHPHQQHHPHPYYQYRSPSHTSSGSTTPVVRNPSESTFMGRREGGKEGSGHTPVQLHINTDVGSSLSNRPDTNTGSGSSSTDEEDAADAEDDTNEEDEDEEEQNEQRKTSLCAGLEKVSRHR